MNIVFHRNIDSNINLELRSYNWNVIYLSLHDDELTNSRNLFEIRFHPLASQGKQKKNQNDLILILNVNKSSNFLIKNHFDFYERQNKINKLYFSTS